MNANSPENSEDDSTINDAVDQLRNKFQNSSLAAVSREEAPTQQDLLAAVGGIRGLVETSLPPLIFLLVFFLSEQHLVWSVSVPLIVSVIFIVIRLVSKSELTSSISGAIGLGLSAALALFSGNLENNFLLGIITNIILLVIFACSVILKRPIIGYVGALLIDSPGWRKTNSKLRYMTIATIIWCLMFAIRVSVQLPLYLNQDSAGLAIAKVALGVPLYAAVLWVTWLMVRAAFLPHKSSRK